jgi:hypothetical protein
MIRKHYDKIFLGVALVALLIAFAFTFLRPSPPPATQDIPRLTSENTYRVSPPPQVNVEVASWEQPSAQSAGEAWVFDLFTPPVIYYNSVIGEFDVRPDRPEQVQPDFGIQLAAIREEDYRVQLLGYVGRPGDFLINLENAETGELVLAREGRQYQQLGIEVRAFRVERDRRGGGDVEVAHVVIFDQRLDREVALRSDQRLKDDRPTAIFRPTGEEGREIRARQGDSFNVGSNTYLVESIEPPLVTVVRVNRETPDERETKTLVVTRRPARQAGEGAEEGAPAPPQPQQQRAPAPQQTQQPRPQQPAQQPPPQAPPQQGREGTEMDFAF